MMALLLKHQADPSLGNSDNVTVTQLVQELNKPEFSQLLDGSSPLLQMSDEELTQGSSKTRIEDYEDLSKIDIPQQNGADPYARYKDPQSVLDHLNRKTFEDIPQDQRVLQNLQHRDTFKPKVQEVKSKRLTPQQRKKQKWTRTTGGQEREKMQQAQNENEEKIDLDALLEEAEMSALQEQEKNNKKGNKNKPNQTQQSKQAQSTSKPIQKEAPKSPEQPKAETKTQNHQTCKTTSEPKSKPAVNNQNTAEPKGKEKAPIARGRKIKKTLKRVSSSSSDDEENQENEIDDDIVVLPSYHNKVSTKQNLPNETAQEEPKQTVSNDSTQQPTSQSSSLSVEEYHNLTKMLFENNKMLTQQQQLLIQQLMAQHQAAYPFYPYMPPPQPMQPPMPSGQMQQPSPSAPMHQQMPFPPMQPPMPNMYPYIIQPPMSPSPIMNVTTDDFQTLAAKVASLEQILAPVLRQSKINQGQPLGICQNCNMQSATSVCPKCGRVFCTPCRHIHIDQQCA